MCSISAIVIVFTIFKLNSIGSFYCNYIIVITKLTYMICRLHLASILNICLVYIVNLSCNRYFYIQFLSFMLVTTFLIKCYLKTVCSYINTSHILGKLSFCNNEKILFFVIFPCVIDNMSFAKT